MIIIILLIVALLSACVECASYYGDYSDYYGQDYGGVDYGGGNEGAKVGKRKQVGV